VTLSNLCRRDSCLTSGEFELNGIGGKQKEDPEGKSRILIKGLLHNESLRELHS